MYDNANDTFVMTILNHHIK